MLAPLCCGQHPSSELTSFRSIARTVSTTPHPRNERRPAAWTVRSTCTAALVCVIAAVPLALAGCSGGNGTNNGNAAVNATIGASMAGPVVDVHITQAAVNARPKAWVLTSPESAVRSYLDWTTYAYRTGQSNVATATMTSYEEVRVDSYIQFNIQKQRLLDQKLTSVTFGKSSVSASGTLVPTKETWSYDYLSIDTGNKLLSGPFTASYDATYTVVKTKSGFWLVDSVKATPKGPVK